MAVPLLPLGNSRHQVIALSGRNYIMQSTSVIYFIILNPRIFYNILSPGVSVNICFLLYGLLVNAKKKNNFISKNSYSFKVLKMYFKLIFILLATIGQAPGKL